MSNESIEFFDDHENSLRVFENAHNGIKADIKDIFLMLCEKEKIDLVKRNKRDFDDIVEVDQSISGKDIIVHAKNNKYFVKNFKFKVRVRGKATDLSRRQVFDYANNDRSIAYHVSWAGKLDVLGEEQDIELVATLTPE